MFYHNRIVKSLVIFLTAFSLIFVAPISFSCTRVLNANNGQAVIVGRTMDWAQEMKTDLVIYPQGIAHNGMTADNPITWTSHYGSIVATVFGAVATDGMNTKGLAAHILWLDEANYGARDKAIPGLSLALWAQFYLDNFATVDEAIRFTQTTSLQLEQAFYPGTQNPITIHLALEDAGGDSAIIEYTDGKAKVFHDRAYHVLTNSPTFDQQLNNLKQYQGFGGNQRLPGTTDSMDRFVRATYYTNHLPEAKSPQEAITSVLSIVQNIAEPYGKPSDEQPEVEPTIWRTAADLTHLIYYFNSSKSFGFIWTDLKNFDLKAGAAVMKLDIDDNPHLLGDVTKNFKPMNS
jgi:penicillin V acylase-like amidase (Ntn superfamily)